MLKEGMETNASHPAYMPAAFSSDIALAQYQEARSQALTQFVHSNRIEPLWQALTRAMDKLLGQMPLAMGLTLVAVGGYGRGELFPYSDIDILLLIDKDTAPDSSIVRLLQQMWDMQIAASHATRTVEESITAAQRDSVIAASLMDTHYIAGNRSRYRELKRRLQKEVIGHDPQRFINAKLIEREKRHAKGGDSRFMLEPNIKEGKGALRDLQMLGWIARYCYRLPKASHMVRVNLLTPEEWQEYRQAYLFFAVVRAHMHQLRGRAEERLTFDLQTEIAVRLKFRGKNAQEKAERLMRRYFQFARHVGALTRAFYVLLEDETLRASPPVVSPRTKSLALPEGYLLDAGRLDFAPMLALREQPSRAVDLFLVAAQQGLEIHPRAYLTLARALPFIGRRLMFEGEANARFLTLLLTAKSPELHLRRMNEAGILGALIPEFERITGMMQYDGYHTYTVDEHMLVAVGNLAAIEQGAWREEVPLASKEIHEIENRTALYVAMLCHDIAKGTGGQHAEKGEAIVMTIAQRLGLDATRIAMAAWLVRHQALFSETAFKRDLDDATTLDDFVRIVETPERLRLLLLLTVADIKAVGPAIWNGWKGALIRELFRRAMERMGVVTPPNGRIRSASSPQLDTLPRAAREAYKQWQDGRNQPALVIQHDRFRAVSEIICCMAFAPGLFRQLAGVMAWIGASIVTARMMVLEGDAALITLAIQNVQGQSFAEEERRLAQLSELIAQAQAGHLDFTRDLPQRRMLSSGGEVTIATSITITNHASATATVVEVSARDRLGLLYDILGAFEECDMQVMSAQLATYGKMATDVFYVKNAAGEKITDPIKLASLQRVLLDSGNGYALNYCI